MGMFMKEAQITIEAKCHFMNNMKKGQGCQCKLNCTAQTHVSIGTREGSHQNGLSIPGHCLFCASLPGRPVHLKCHLSFLLPDGLMCFNSCPSTLPPEQPKCLITASTFSHLTGSSALEASGTDAGGWPTCRGGG